MKVIFEILLRIERIRILVCILVFRFLFFSCTSENNPPTAKIEVTPLTGEVPLEVKMKLTGEDPDGVGDITGYHLYVGSEMIKSKTPVEITRTFQNAGKVVVYGEVIDSKNHIDKTDINSIESVLGPYIDQSASLVYNNELNYSATIHKFTNAEFKLNKNGNLFLSQIINDNSQTGPDFQKTFRYSPDGITKGIYEFILKAGELEKKTSVEVPNYNPTMNLGGINGDLMEGTKKTLTLPEPLDKNPEDLPVSINSVRSLDGKTIPTLNGKILTIKSVWDKVGNYQVEINFGSTGGGLEKAILQGNVTDDTRWRIDPFVSTNANGGAYDLLTTKFKRDSLVQVKLNEDWTNTILYKPDPLWDCTEYSIQLYINFHGNPDLTGYSGNNLDSIYFYHRTLKDNGKYGLPIYFIYLSGEGTEHNMNCILTGNDATKWEDWSFIEPQRDQINVQPGEAYMPRNCYIRISAPPKDNNGQYQGWIPIVEFNVENGVPNLLWVNESQTLNFIKKR